MDPILVIDDDPHFTQLIALAFSQDGFSVDIAHASNTAIDYIKNKRYSAILQDVFFPNKEDGLELMDNYYPFTKQNHTPIILMTNLPYDFMRQETNMDHYLSISKLFISKGENIKEIVKRVKEIVEEKT